MDTGIRLTPRKKLCVDFPASSAEDSPRKSSLRLRPQTPTQADTVRMSPRKTGQTPSTPTRVQMTPRRCSKVRQAKEEGAQITQKEDVKATELQRDAHVLPTAKSCSDTQVNGWQYQSNLLGIRTANHFGDPLVFSATMRLTVVVLSEMSPQVLNDCHNI